MDLWYITNRCLPQSMYIGTRGVARIFIRGGVQLEAGVVLQAMGHRGQVWEGDVPLPAKGRSFWHF